MCYSGTGNTKKVADCFINTLAARGVEADLFAIRAGNPYPDEPKDLLIITFPVHAFNAPDGIYRWIRALPEGLGRKAAVISVSGGGDAFPQRSSRAGCISRLKKKGYDVVYDKMLAMPSNWMVPTDEAVAHKLLEVLPRKVSRIVDDLLAGRARREKFHPADRLISHIMEIEKVGARRFGRRLQCGANCSGCGWCAENCPAGNIQMENGRPRFMDRCNMCLGCVYGCPRQAVSPGMMKSVAIAGGFSLKKLESGMAASGSANTALPKGVLWKGLTAYLEEDGGEVRG